MPVSSSRPISDGSDSATRSAAVPNAPPPQTARRRGSLSGLGRAAEEQEQHQVDAGDAREHREGETEEQLRQGLRVARRAHGSPRAALVAQARRSQRRRHLAQGRPFSSAPTLMLRSPVEAVDLCGTAATRGWSRPRRAAPGPFRHRAPAAARSRPSRRERRVGDLHADRDLPLGEVQLGERWAEVAAGGDARGVGDVDGRHAQVSRPRGIRTDHDLGIQQRRRGRDAAKALQCAYRGRQLPRHHVQLLRIAARDHRADRRARPWAGGRKLAQRPGPGAAVPDVVFQFLVLRCGRT